MTYSKSRPKILSSGIMDALSSFAYFVLAILFFIFGAVLLNTDVSGGEDNMSGAIQEIGGAFATGILGVLSIVVGIICLIAMLISLVGTVITLRSPVKPPYAVYFQGGLTWYHAKLGILMSLQKLYERNLVNIDELC